MKPTTIKRAHINKLLSVLPVYSERNIERLRKLLDCVKTHYHGLEAMGVDEDSYSTIVVPVILDKIPEAVKLNMICSTKGHQECMMNKLLSALEAEIREFTI